MVVVGQRDNEIVSAFYFCSDWVVRYTTFSIETKDSVHMNGLDFSRSIHMMAPEIGCYGEKYQSIDHSALFTGTVVLKKQFNI